MANETTVKTKKKTRTPRVLTALEQEAKQQFEDAKSLGKILPAVDKLTPWGMLKLRAYVIADRVSNE